MAYPKPRIWTPKNPHKYNGNAKLIVTRSSWETRAMHFFDLNENVLMWASEEFSIKYVSPLDNKEHRYFCDFLAKMKMKNGQEKTFLIEIKPFVQCHISTAKNKKRFITEMSAYTVNQAKWKAAEEFCKQKGIEFLILDEYSLGIKKRNNNEIH